MARRNKNPRESTQMQINHMRVMSAIISFIREECARQKQISDAAPDDHRRDYAELNKTFRELLNSMQ